MMRRYWMIAMAWAALSASLANADQNERGPPPHRRGDDERMLRMQRQEMPAQAQPMQSMQASAHHGRMSPEERRQLRRDIDAAGRELYQPPSQRH